MRILKKLIKRMLVLPVLNVVDGNSAVDMDELNRIVRERTARAEKSVLKDYFAQLGLSEEQASAAEQSYRAGKRSPTNEQLAAAEKRAKDAENVAKLAQSEAAARVQMALLGVKEECFSDVLKLAADDISDAAADTDVNTESVRHAIESVIQRVPSFTGNDSALSAGTPGRFPRGGNAAESFRRQLDRARAMHDNATAAAIISQAAEKGIALR